MPSPVGHALGGVIVAACLPPDSLGRGSEHAPSSRTWIVLVIAAAVAPDLDFVWGRHNMETHSLGAALLAGLVTLAIWRVPRLALAVSLAWASHVLFDWLGSDTTPPLGVMALWPASSAFYFADAFVFEAISRRTYLANFWSHNLWAVAREMLILGPLAALAAWGRWKGRL